MSMLNPTAVVAEVGRVLETEDLALLQTTKVGATTPKLKKIRAVHHAAARLLATGMKESEVSLNVGLCPSRISILKNDPAFRDLMTHYETAEKDRFAVVQDRMVMLGLVAADELQERIIESPEDVPTRDLTDILRHSLDRGGHAPVSKSETKTTHALDPTTIAAMKQTALENQNGRVIHRRPTKTLPASAGENPADNAHNEGAVAGAETPTGIEIEGTRV